MNTVNSSGLPPVVLISGYRGLAKTLIEEFRPTCSVSVLVRKPELIRDLQKEYTDVFFVPGDVVNGSDCKVWIDSTLSHFGRIDCLINNAAVSGPTGRVNDISFMDFRLAIDINFLAPVRLMKFVLPHFLNQKSGVVINLSGGGATQARPYFSSYASAKCALVRFTESIALEYPELRFYAVSPGALMTPMIEKLLTQDPSTIGPEYREAQKREQEGGEDPGKAGALCRWLLENYPAHLSGALVSAVWDDYRNAPQLPHGAGWWRLRRVDKVLSERLKGEEV